MDPEALSREDKRFRAQLGRIVGRYGGMIASTLGDEVMAVFGVPRAHEDDAFRAACAAVDIRDASARDEITPVSIPRVGIATGEILASGSGAGAALGRRRAGDRGGGAPERRRSRADPHR